MQLTRDYLKASNGAANASLMTVQNVRAPLATSIIVNTVAGAPVYFMGSMGTPHTFTDPITGETITVISEATAVDFAGHIDSGHVEIDEIAPGYTDLGSAVGDIIMIRPITRWADIVSEFVSPTGVITPFAGAAAPSNWLLCDGASLLRADYPRLFNVIGTSYGSVDATHFNTPDLRGRSPVGVGTGTFAELFAAAAVTIATDLITVSAAAGKQLLNGTPVVLTTSGTAPAGLTAGNTYYVIAVSGTTIKLASSLANAVAGTAIDITSQGTGNHTLTMTLSARALAERGGEEGHANTIAETASHTHPVPRVASQSNIATPGYGTSLLWFGDGSPGTGAAQATGGSGAHNNMQPFLALNYIIKT